MLEINVWQCWVFESLLQVIDMKHHVLIVFRGRVCNSTHRWVCLLTLPELRPTSVPMLLSSVYSWSIKRFARLDLALGMTTPMPKISWKTVTNGSKWPWLSILCWLLRKRKIPGHLAEVAILDKVVTLREALLCFQDAGEAFAWSPKVAVTR